MINSVACDNKLWVKVLDQVESAHQMKEQLPHAIKWLEEQRGQNILIHCASGVSRSATVAIAFMMKQKNISLLTAY